MQLSKEFRDRFVKRLQGKDFILYGGLLELAKQRGLKRIHTKIVQIPTKENGMYAVVEAQIETEDGVFEEVGDASPESVNRQIAPHILRMASTRAKARAMRDAVGIDMVALEELSEVPEENEGVTARPEDIRISFGKYNNKTLGEIMEIDQNYVEWLSLNARDEQVKHAAKKILMAGKPLEKNEDKIEMPLQ
jgi:hypothetical protein